MKKEELKVKNRKGLNISIIVEIPDNPRGLAFVVHGLSSYKDEVYIEMFAHTFVEAGFSVVRYDATNSIGDSEGDTINATLTSYFEDLEDIVSWAKGKDWYKETFILLGHSMGGACSLLYTLKYPEKVRAVAPISTVISGEFFMSSEFIPEKHLDNWKKQGFMEGENKSKPGLIYKIGWGLLEDIKKYNLLEKVDKINVPVLMMVGELDRGTPVDHQRALFDRLKTRKEFHIIKGAYHNFRHKEHLEEMKGILREWIGKIT